MSAQGMRQTETHIIPMLDATKDLFDSGSKPVAFSDCVSLVQSTLGPGRA